MSLSFPLCSSRSCLSVCRRVVVSHVRPPRCTVAIVTWPNDRIGDASRGIYTTSAAGLDKHLPISDYCCSMYTSLVSVIKRKIASGKISGRGNLGWNSRKRKSGPIGTSSEWALWSTEIRRVIRRDHDFFVSVRDTFRDIVIRVACAVWFARFGDVLRFPTQV